MDQLSGEIFPLVFRRAVRKDPGEFSLDNQVLSVLLELDGKKNLGILSRQMGMEIGTMRNTISRLLKLGLIVQAEDGFSCLDKDFFDYLHTHLSLAIGPLAEILVEDAVADLGHPMLQFPSGRAAELVDLLSREIQREQKRTAFKQEMIKKMKEKGYLSQAMSSV